MKTRMLLAVLLFSPTLALGQEKPRTGEVRVYVADANRAPVDLKGMTAMVIVEPVRGKRRVIRLEAVFPKGTSKTSEAGLGHGGEVRAAGAYVVELVLREPGESDHDAGDATPYFSGAIPLSGYTCGMSGHPVVLKPGTCTKCPMNLEPVDLEFSAVVVLRKGGKSANVKGFKYPSEVPQSYVDGIARIQAHIGAIQALIDGGKLKRVHPVARKISQVCKLLPPLAPKGKEAAVSATCKAIIALFAEVDQAADNERKKVTQAVLEKYERKLKELKALL